jgi:hypothetical protein
MKTSILISAVLAALGIAASASAATRSESSVFTAQAQTEVRALTLAKHGADDGVDGADDNGVDFIIGKHGADDGVDGADDNGVDFILAKHGADDLVDGEDDHGIDFILG